MANLLTRNVSEETKQALAMLASSLGVSPNTLRLWILEEAANPYSEFVAAIRDRAYEVETNKNRRLVLKGDSDNSSNSPTLPIGRKR